MWTYDDDDDDDDNDDDDEEEEDEGELVQTEDENSFDHDLNPNNMAPYLVGVFCNHFAFRLGQLR